MSRSSSRPTDPARQRPTRSGDADLTTATAAGCLAISLIGTLVAALLSVATGCSGKNPTESHTSAAPRLLTLEAPRLRPSPGVDIGPLPPPRSAARTINEGAVTPVDLGSDRPPLEVAVPRPPRGGAVGFSFADDRRGWVARIPEGMQLPALAFGEKMIYVSGGFDSTSFYALDAEAGTVRWSSQALEDNGPTAPIYDDGMVVFNTESCTIFVLAAATGKKLWFKYLGDPTLAQPAVADGLVFTSHPSDGTSGYSLTAFKVRSGRQVWSRSIDAELLVGPTIDGDSIYVSSINGYSYRFLRENGKRVWRRRLRATTSPWIVAGHMYVTQRSRGHEVQIVVDTESGAIIATHDQVISPAIGDVPRNLNDWKKVWAYEGARPVVSDGIRYVAMAGQVSASDAESGELLWIRRYAGGADQRSLGTVALAGPQVVVSTRAGQLYGLDIDTGYTLWAYDLGHKVVAEPIIANGWIYTATRDGQVIALNVADSTLDGWHMFGGNPHHNGPVAAKD